MRCLFYLNCLLFNKFYIYLNTSPLSATFLKNKLTDLFLAVLGGFISSCGKRGLLSSCGAWASHCSGFSCRRAQFSRVHRLQ